MIKSNLVKEFEIAAKDLGLEIEAPFSLEIEEGIVINIDILLKNFGNREGMLVVNKFEKLSPYANKLVELGYGISTIGEPDSPDEFHRNVFIEMLSEWGWCGPENEKPDWVIDRDDLGFED